MPYLNTYVHKGGPLSQRIRVLGMDGTNATKGGNMTSGNVSSGNMAELRSLLPTN